MSDTPIELESVELPPLPEAGLLRLALAAVALVELVLAMVLYMAGGAVGELCPGAGGSWSCGTLFRERVGALGPTSVAALGAAGGLVTLAVAWDLLFRGGRTALARVAALALGAGAGFALGVQALAVGAQGAACPPCLALALLAVACAGLAAAVRRREAGASPLGPALACGLVLLATATLGWTRGAAIAAEDRSRGAAALGAGGAEGPRILFFERPGCPFCAGLLADGLGDPAVVAQLGRTRGVERVGPGDPRVAAFGIEGAPVLVAVDRDGRAVGRPLVGYQGPAAVGAWIAALLR